jgi:D-alanyl-D-alanine carboxypeptidase
MRQRGKLLIVLVVVLVTLVAVVLIFKNEANAPSPQNRQPSETSRQATTTSEFDKNKYSVSEPGSPWWIVNKKRALPDGYVPPDLGVPNVRLRLNANQEQMQFSQSTTTDLEAMFAAAAAEGISLVFGSGYRSFALQAQFYNSYVAQDGREAADRYSARPGTSEHQTGLSFDVTAANGACHLEICFAETPEGQWIAKRAYEYGFIIRYPDSKENITGYQYEPWHLRWVGKELAVEMKNTGVTTLEEFFGLPAAPDY